MARLLSTAARSARAICSARISGSTASGSVAAMCSILASWFLACSAMSARASRACSTVMPSGSLPPIGPACAAAGLAAAPAHCRRALRLLHGTASGRRGLRSVPRQVGQARIRAACCRRDHGHGRGDCLFLELHEPELAARGRPASGQLLFLFRQLLDGSQGRTVPGPDLGGTLGSGAGRHGIHGAGSNAADTPGACRAGWRASGRSAARVWGPPVRGASALPVRPAVSRQALPRRHPWCRRPGSCPGLHLWPSVVHGGCGRVAVPDSSKTHSVLAGSSVSVSAELLFWAGGAA